MAFNVWQQFIELNGNAAAGASIEVRKMSDNSLVSPLASDSAGSVLGNPFTADSNGFARFYAPAGQYKITATYSGNSFSLTDVLLGDAAGRDVGTGATDILDKAAADTLYASTRKYNVSDTAPTVTDDISGGYTAGSQWLRPTSGELYQSFASTAGAADWRLIDTGVSFGTMAVKDEGAGATEFRNNQDAEAYFASQGALTSEVALLQGDIDGKVTDAPIDGKAYARKDAAWTEVTMGGAGFDPAAPQTITGQWSFDISGGKSFMATDGGSNLWGLSNHSPTFFPASVLLGGLCANSVAGTDGRIAVTLNDDGSSTGNFKAGGAEITAADSATNKTIVLIHSGTNYITIDHLLGTIKLGALPTHADEAAAVIAGLATDTVYKTATGELRIKL